MKIEPNMLVTLEYRLLDLESGDCLDDTTTQSDPMSFVSGYGMVVPGLEAGLQGMSEGEMKRIELDPSAAFGLRDDELVFELPLSELPEGMKPKPGDELEIDTDEDGAETFVVVEVSGENVLLDANHPLAGREVVYEVKVRGVRPATPEEIESAAEVFESAREEFGETEVQGLVTLKRGKSN